MIANFTTQADFATQAYALADRFLISSSSLGRGASDDRMAAQSSSVTVATAAAFAITTATMGGLGSSGHSQIWAPVIKTSFSGVSTQAGGGLFRDSAELASLQHSYQMLASAVEYMGNLDEDDGHYLDPQTIDSSKEFLNLISAFGVPSPRLFPHGGDALVFEWPRGDGVRYVTYEDCAARLRDYGDGAEYVDPMTYDLRQEGDIANLIQALGGRQWRVKQSSSSI